MQKIPQAVAMVLLTSALAASGMAQDQQPAGGRPSGGSDASRGPGEAQKPVAMPIRAYSQIKNLLNEFLANVEDPAMHERFWADDLIYTGASGVVRTKQEIVKSVREEKAKPKTPAGAQDAIHQPAPDSYEATHIQVRQYGEVAVLNFELIHHIGAKTDHYRNTGTFVERNGQWQAVSWQATKIEKSEPVAEKKPTGKE